MPMNKVWICSFRRSGNHWLQAALESNFGGLVTEKAHLFPSEVLSFLRPGDRLVYLIRYPGDVATSNYDWARTSGEARSERRLGFEPPRDFTEFLRQPRRFCMGSVLRRRATPQNREHHRRYGGLTVLEYWVAHVQDFLGLPSGSIPLIRYEDLRGDFAGSLARLAGGLGLEPPSGWKVVDHLVGYQPRHGLVGDWRRGFSVDDRALLARLVNPTLRRVGYPDILPDGWGDFSSVAVSAPCADLGG